MDTLSFSILIIGVLALVVGLMLFVEKRWSTPKGSDWYDTATDDEVKALLGVVSPKKEKKD
jgi:hypothetical protein